MTDLGLVPLFTGATKPAILVVPSNRGTDTGAVRGTGQLRNYSISSINSNLSVTRTRLASACENELWSSPSRVLTQRQLPG